MTLLDTDHTTPTIAPRDARRLGAATGLLVHGPNLLQQDCSVRDLSATGARVRLFSTAPLPRTLWFLDVRAGEAHAAEVMWQRHPDVGLALRGRVDLEQDGRPEVRTLRRLLAEAKQG